MNMNNQPIITAIAITPITPPEATPATLDLADDRLSVGSGPEDVTVVVWFALVVTDGLAEVVVEVVAEGVELADEVTSDLSALGRLLVNPVL